MTYKMFTEMTIIYFENNVKDDNHLVSGFFIKKISGPEMNSSMKQCQTRLFSFNGKSHDVHLFIRALFRTMGWSLGKGEGHRL